jgi:hypothetical protein
MNSTAKDKPAIVFILQIFNVPENIKRGNLRIEHDKIEDWELMDVATEKGQRVANVTLNTRLPIEVSALAGEISVASDLHDVQGVDIGIAAW